MFLLNRKCFSMNYTVSINSKVNSCDTSEVKITLIFEKCEILYTDKREHQNLVATQVYKLIVFRFKCLKTG